MNYFPWEKERENVGVASEHVEPLMMSIGGELCDDILFTSPADCEV